ncbi:hypothetical protein [Chryseobacterium indologenes]|uniref:Uncharacterized protein n=1 Tax=Chryseobacterium indologenes TaxID=253 RepID=A0A0N0ZT32_CHRID|nr:hypothetical protein [Chryseobacterium indologenes]KPE49308.1 hypothetical protein AOB46_20170 [Chryseobacterium indologenes]
MAAGEVNVEFGIQTADIGGKDNTVVYTSHNETSANSVYSGDNVKLSGHLHPGFMLSQNGGGIDFSGPLNPSGFMMSKFPTKENGYTFSIIKSAIKGDRASAEKMSKAIHFIYSPNYNTTVIYNSSTIIKAYEGKFKKD